MSTATALILCVACVVALATTTISTSAAATAPQQRHHHVHVTEIKRVSPSSNEMTTVEENKTIVTTPWENGTHNSASVAASLKEKTAALMRGHPNLLQVHNNYSDHNFSVNDQIQYNAVTGAGDKNFYSSNTFSLNAAKSALGFIQGGLCHADTIPRWSCPPCAKHPNFRVEAVISTNLLETNTLIGYDPDTEQIVVAPPGTNTTLNWVEDFIFFSVIYPHCVGCFVHEGFYVLWIAMQDKVMNHLKALLRRYPNTKTVLVTGHSLGGALALLAALSIRQDLYSKQPHLPPLQLYTFGQPRVGNLLFAQHAVHLLSDGHYFRVTRQNDDVVPLVPSRLEPLSLGFAHAPHEVYFLTTNADKSVALGGPVHCHDSAFHEDSHCVASHFDTTNSAQHLYYLGMTVTCDGN